MDKMHLLVTGGCGFIGTNFIRHMLSAYPYGPAQRNGRTISLMAVGSPKSFLTALKTGGKQF
jgi:nucleoside-diphosphate-sugar epimerase